MEIHLTAPSIKGRPNAYGTTVKGADEEVEVDIDELLDMDSDDQRRKHLEVVLADAKKSRNDVQSTTRHVLRRVMYATYKFMYLLHKLKYRLVFTLFGSFCVFYMPTLLTQLLNEGTSFTFFYLCLSDTNAVHDDDVKFSQEDSIHLNKWESILADSDFDGQVTSRDLMRDPKKDHWYWVGTECKRGAFLRVKKNVVQM
ncbi:hypothetical protein RUM43_009748 [Polyplax serrata]|uniref:Uncharacterized protein n=1 Tax=Polyplax serrata TaxID=468196 RepID=A0AAN8PJM9_POLSC